MRRFVTLTVLLLTSSLFALAFGQSEESTPPAIDIDLSIVISEYVIDGAGLIITRVESALDRARAKLARRALPPSPLQLEETVDVPYIPFQISFSPGLAIPFGYYDVSLSAGAIGTLTRDVQGLAGAGVFNLSRDIQGAEFGGVFNIARNIEGAQLAGVFNIAGGSVDGAQLAGVFNIGERVRGMQASGLFNISKEYFGPFNLAGLFSITGDAKGAQFAGLFTVADSIQGAQVSSIVNVAGRMSGLQVGLINIADQIDGVQLGLINIAQNGVGGIGALYEVVTGRSWAYWQNGTPQFFTVFMAGMPHENWNKSIDQLVVSAGAGSRLTLGRPYIDFELAALWDVSASANSLHRDYANSAMPASWETAQGSLGRAADLASRPWPALSISCGVPVLWRLHFVGGLRVDLDLDNWPALPESMKTGIVTRNMNWFGFGFSTYTKWYFGFRF